MNTIAWLVLRIILAWMFLYPLLAIFNDWQAMVDSMELIVPFAKQFFALTMVCVMVVSALSVAFGFYGQFGGLLMCLYCLVGMLYHYRTANIIRDTTLSDKASEQDISSFEKTKILGIIGHITSAEKNLPIAAASFFIFLMGTGPFSLTSKILF